MPVGVPSAVDKFLSTLPARGATDHGKQPDVPAVISIHAPREGSDRRPDAALPLLCDFYPRSPRGERQPLHGGAAARLQFLSTLPARGATSARRARTSRYLFLSTLPARGATGPAIPKRYARPIFLSTLPARGATPPVKNKRREKKYFYPRSPRGERPLGDGRLPACPAQFLSTLPARGATRLSCGTRNGRSLFLSTLPARGATVTNM